MTKMKTLITSILTFMCCVGMGQKHKEKNKEPVISIRAYVEGKYIWNVYYKDGKPIDSVKTKTGIYVDDFADWGGGLVDMKFWNNSNFIDSIYPKRDTIEVLALVTDTTHEYTEPNFVDSATMISDSTNILWWHNGKQVYPIDLGRKTEMPTYSTIIYAVRELHNTSEGVIDPYNCYNCNYKDYWKDLYYLDANKLPLKKSIIIWQVKYLK